MRLLAICSLIALLGCAEPNTAPHTETFQGQLVLKPWQKSTDSYCAGGSEYFVLQAEDGNSQVLQTPEVLDQWQAYVDHTVVIQGYLQEKVISPPSDLSQHPQQPILQQVPADSAPEATTEPTPFRCQILVVEQIQLQ